MSSFASCVIEVIKILTSDILSGLSQIFSSVNNSGKRLINRAVVSCTSSDKEIIPEWKKIILEARKNGSSLGAIIEVRCSGIPAGLGEPVYDKLDAELAKSMMSINAVKGVEIGSGFESVSLPGESNVDEIRIENGKPKFLSNNAGGILGGISTGQDIVIRFCVKPTSSILTSRKTIDINMKETEITTKGRHDPCVGIRAVPVGEAMMATTLADHCLRFL